MTISPDNIVFNSDHEMQKSQQRKMAEAESRTARFTMTVTSEVKEEDIDTWLITADPGALDELGIEDRGTEDDEERDKVAEVMAVRDARFALTIPDAGQYIGHEINSVRKPGMDDLINQYL